MRSSIYISHHPEGERQKAVANLQGFALAVFLWRGGCGGMVGAGCGGWLRLRVAVAGGGRLLVLGAAWHGSKTILSGGLAVVAAADWLRFRGRREAGAVQRIGMY